MRYLVFILCFISTACGNLEKKQDNRKADGKDSPEQNEENIENDKKIDANKPGIDKKNINLEDSNLIMGIGGFLSCTSDSQKAALSKITAAFKTKIAVRSDNKSVILETCFGSSPTEISYRILGEVEEWTSITAEKLVELANLKSGVTALTDIYLTGYSYGGWLALKVATELKQERNLVNFVTIDPISPTGCNINNIFNSPIGCKHAPADFSVEQKQELALRTNWINFYQSNFTLLHSSEIEEADLNFEKTYDPGDLFSGTAHDAIVRDQTVLDTILENL